MICQKKNGEEESTWVQKLKTNHRLWEHNSSNTRHLLSHTPLMFRDFNDKLREWSSLLEPGQACSCHYKLLCSHGVRSVKLQMRLVKPCAVGTRLKKFVPALDFCFQIRPYQDGSTGHSAPYRSTYML